MVTPPSPVRASVVRSSGFWDDAAMRRLEASEVSLREVFSDSYAFRIPDYRRPTPAASVSSISSNHRCVVTDVILNVLRPFVLRWCCW